MQIEAISALLSASAIEPSTALELSDVLRSGSDRGDSLSHAVAERALAQLAGVGLADEQVSHTDEQVSHTNEQISHTGEEVSHTDEEVSHTNEQISHMEVQVSHTDEEVSHTDEQVSYTNEQISHMDIEVCHTDKEVSHTDEQGANRANVELQYQKQNRYVMLNNSYRANHLNGNEFVFLDNLIFTIF